MDNQSPYWNRVAGEKIFTHPLDPGLVKKYFTKQGSIIDYGCGYGRLVSQLIELGYHHICGYDTSEKLIERGKSTAPLPLYAINDLCELPMPDDSIDHVLLFAVLTCIPSNEGQTKLMDVLHKKLKPKGILYISDYYLQENPEEGIQYKYLNNDPHNYGVFTLPEGVVFRHHTREWITELVSDFTVLEHKTIKVKTMNGSNATAFQLIVRK